MISLGRVVPVLRSFDEARMQAYYEEWLGFARAFEHRFEPGAPLYCGLERDGTELHLTEHFGDATPGSHVRIAAVDVGALLAELQSRPIANMRPAIVTQPWGMREMTLWDPFGNRLTFFSQ